MDALEPTPYKPTKCASTVTRPGDLFPDRCCLDHGHLGEHRTATTALGLAYKSVSWMDVDNAS